MCHLISQGAFVKGRQISDLVLIENKMTDTKLHSGEEGVIIKIAYEKTYDQLHPGFINHALYKISP